MLIFGGVCVIQVVGRSVGWHDSVWNLSRVSYQVKDLVSGNGNDLISVGSYQSVGFAFDKSPFFGEPHLKREPNFNSFTVSWQVFLQVMSQRFNKNINNCGDRVDGKCSENTKLPSSSTLPLNGKRISTVPVFFRSEWMKLLLFAGG